MVLFQVEADSLLRQFNFVVSAMNKTIGIQLVIFGLMLAGLSYVIYQMAPSIGQTTFITGLAGGALCLVWGTRAIAGARGKALPILTLLPVGFVLLAQTVIYWGQAGWTVTAVMALVLMLSLAMMLRVVWAGAFDQPPAAAVDGTPAKQEKAKI